VTDRSHPDFNASDVALLARRGISTAQARRDVAACARPPSLVVDRPCTPGDGVRRLDDLAPWHAHFDTAVGRVGRFVPASGAATRMFRDLQARTPEALSRFEAERPLGDVDVETALSRYAGRPKALVPFHAGRTALELQLEETTDYADWLHLSIAGAHREAFEVALRDAAVPVGFSEQAPATDVVAADPRGGPFRTDEGALLIRPGGHGALIGNLGALGGDIVFIKNIDNVQPRGRRGPTRRWKRALGGLLVRLQAATYGHVRRLRAGEGFAAARAFVRDELSIGGVPDAALLDRLDRPLRVCGVVRNTGQPGGGPFWARDPDGFMTPQIVEAQQLSDPRLLERATHFNPVDLVCGLRDADGQPHDLHRFVDPDAAMVSEKSHQGRPLLALERPGLWNGAMSGWNTVFVCVPHETFTPVKTVFDLGAVGD